MAAKYVLALILLAGSLFAFIGCEHAPVKPTEDSKRLQQIDAFIEDLRRAYEGRDAQSFSALYGIGRPEDREAILSWLNSTDAPRLDLLIDRIVLKENNVRISLHWELRWQSGKNAPVTQRGSAVFKLAGGSELRLQAVEGDNPFPAPVSFAAPPP